MWPAVFSVRSIIAGSVRDRVARVDSAAPATKKRMLMQDSYKTLIYVTAVTLLAAWLVWLWYGKQPTASQDWQQAPPAGQVAGIPRVDYSAPKKIRVIPKKAASKALDLPQDVAQDDNQQVIATADIAPAPDGATAVTIMDTTTGESKVLVKAKPRPLFAFLRSGAAGIRYGIDSRGDQQAALFVRQDVLRVGNVHLGLTAEARTVPTRGEAEAYGAVEVSYRW